ncbi:MAG: HAD family hydrolase [Clostridiales bacterium]|nr:HAD family hydrolase [Clostridiales bacterium]
MDTFLFDLDGTLLPMDQDEFIEGYIKGVAKKLLPYDIDNKILIATIWEGTKAMIENDGTMYNKERFWNRANDIIGERIRELEDVFYDYYKNEFQDMRHATKPNPLAKASIDLLKEKGYRIILATNPVFPPVATHSRIYWAGMEPEDFEWITTYDNSSYCKPNIEYFKEILKNRGLTEKQCIMVGNDASDDLSAKNIGMDVFLVTDCLINTKGVDINQFRKGTFEMLYDYIKELPHIPEHGK